MSARLSLAPKLDLKGATALADELRDKRGSDLVLDAARTKHIGAMGVQVLLSAAATWAEDGRALSMADVSDACVDQLHLLGFSPERLMAGGTA
jgi:chemotaxis protein CheX